MEVCFYQGTELCTYDLKDEQGIYYQEIVMEWKRRAAEKKLFCVDCGSPVYLAAGLKKEPYFAHYDIVACLYGKSVESQEHVRGKRLLYQMVKRSFPTKEISIRHRLPNGLYTTCFVKNETGIDLALDYRLQPLPIKELDLRVQYYDEQQILPVFVLGERQDKKQGQLSWYQTYLQNLSQCCAFLDTEEEMLCLKQNVTHVSQGVRKSMVFERKYSIHEMMLSEDGTYDCDFYSACETLRKELKEKEEQEKQIAWEQKEREKRYYEEQVQQEKLKYGLQEEKKLEFEQKLKEYQAWCKKDSLSKIDFQSIPLPEGIRRDLLVHCVELMGKQEEELISRRYLEFLYQLIEEEYSAAP